MNFPRGSPKVRLQERLPPPAERFATCGRPFRYLRKDPPAFLLLCFDFCRSCFRASFPFFFIRILFQREQLPLWQYMRTESLRDPPARTEADGQTAKKTLSRVGKRRVDSKKKFSGSAKRCFALPSISRPQKRPEFLRPRISLVGDSADDPVVRTGRNPIDKGVKEREQKEASDGNPGKQQDVCQIEQHQQSPDHGKGERQVHSRKQQRQEENREQLGIDAPSDLLFRHAYPLHDLEAPLDPRIPRRSACSR